MKRNFIGKEENKTTSCKWPGGVEYKFCFFCFFETQGQIPLQEELSTSLTAAVCGTMKIYHCSQRRELNS